MFKSLSLTRLIDDDYRRHVQMIILPLIAGFVSFGMFVLNIFTHKTVLMYSTLIYSILSLLNAYMEYRSKRVRVPAVAMFSSTTILLFSSFLIYGGTEGFSPIWICALPPCALLMMGRKKGSVICAVMLLIVIFCFWTPAGNRLLIYRYTNSCLMRFPLVYIALYLVGLFFETIREATYNALLKAQKQYKELSIKDSLTETYNRNWFNDAFTEILRRPEARPAALLIVDIDFFKSFNDEHGHLFGDEVLKRTASVLREQIGDCGSVCRWGGEEFAILMEHCGCDLMNERAESLRKTIERTVIQDENGYNFNLTVSIGAVCLGQSDSMSLDKLISLADAELYKAKTDGRNCVRAGCVGCKDA